MSNGPGTDAVGEAVAAGRRHRTLRGTLVASAAFVRRLGHAAFLCRTVYNAVVDPDVPFAEGVALPRPSANALDPDAMIRPGHGNLQPSACPTNRFTLGAENATVQNHAARNSVGPSHRCMASRTPKVTTDM